MITTSAANRRADQTISALHVGPLATVGRVVHWFLDLDGASTLGDQPTLIETFGAHFGLGFVGEHDPVAAPFAFDEHFRFP